MTQQISYPIPTGPVVYEESIKRSRFIVHIAHTPDVMAAKEFMASIRAEYPDARHHCWAHVAGPPKGSHSLGFSDDGEPTGTAGKPMLNVLVGSGIGEITAVVTRYFGGIKLGTGGLVRAYGGSLNHAMVELKTHEKIPEMTIIGFSDYGFQASIEQVFSNFTVLDIQKTYTENVKWKVIVDARQAGDVIEHVINRTSGKVIFELLD